MSSPHPSIESCEVRSARSDRRLVIAIRGDLDLASAPEAGACAVQLLTELPVDEVVVDLEHLRFVDSSGLAALINLRHEADRVDVSMRTVGATEAVRRTLELTGLLEYLNVDGG